MVLVSIDTTEFSLLPQEVRRSGRYAIIEHEAPLVDDSPVEFMGKHQSEIIIQGFVQIPETVDPLAFVDQLEALVGSHRLIKVETTTKGKFFINDIFQITNSDARMPAEFAYDKFYYTLRAKRSRTSIVGISELSPTGSFSAPELNAIAVKATGNQIKAQAGAISVFTGNSLGNSGGRWDTRFAIYSHDTTNNRPLNLLSLTPIVEGYGPKISAPPSPILDLSPTAFYWVAFAYKRTGTSSFMSVLFKDFLGVNKTQVIVDLNSFPNPWTSSSGGTTNVVSQAWMGI